MNGSCLAAEVAHIREAIARWSGASEKAAAENRGALFEEIQVWKSLKSPMLS